MTRELLDKLLTVIDAKISTAFARDSSDGGLIEVIRELDLLKELQAMCDKD